MLRRRPDPVALTVVFAAAVAWIFGVGWWTPVVGTMLVGFGPGYLLLHAAAHAVPSRIVRAALYLGTSLAIAALVGFAISTTGFPLVYPSYASVYLVLVSSLFLLEVIVNPPDVRVATKRHRSRPDGPALIQGAVLVAAPLVVTLALLVTAPVRNPANTELYFAGSSGQLRDLPSTFRRGEPIQLRVIGSIQALAADTTLEILVDDRLVESLNVGPDSTTIDRLVSLDTELFNPKQSRVEARLRSSGERDYAVWLNLTEVSGK